MSPDCPFCRNDCEPLQEFVPDEAPENYAHVCPSCGKVVFVAESDGYPLQHLFLPALKGRVVEAVVAEKEYRLALFEAGIALEWAVFVSKYAEIMAFKDADYRWEQVYSPQNKKRGRRAKVCLRLKNRGGYFKPAVARVVNYAWRNLAERPWATVEHINDDLDDDSLGNTKIGGRRSNAKTKHELRRQGKEPRKNWIDIKVRRETKARLVTVTGKRGIKLDQAADDILSRFIDDSGANETPHGNGDEIR